jgi:hypothetical protein
MNLLERDVLKRSLSILNRVYGEWVRVERRQVVRFRNPGGQIYRFGKTGQSDIGGWVLKGPYIAKPIAIETKRSSFRPTHLSRKDKIHFQEQCDYLRKINNDGGIGFWINDPGLIYQILTPVLINGSKIDLDVYNHVLIIKGDRNHEEADRS